MNELWKICFSMLITLYKQGYHVYSDFFNDDINIKLIYYIMSIYSHALSSTILLLSTLTKRANLPTLISNQWFNHVFLINFTKNIKT